MTADVLRRAAALMRERAAACIPDGTLDFGDWHESYWFDGPGSEDSQHQASWHPAVALAVADWLDHEARLIDEYERQGRKPAAVRVSNAVTVARAYLGDDE